MRGDTHVRFGGRARETDPGQPGHRARARPNRSDTAEIMPDHWRPSITAGQRQVRHSGTQQAVWDRASTQIWTRRPELWRIREALVVTRDVVQFSVLTRRARADRGGRTGSGK
jgi:hypothetical protein